MPRLHHLLALVAVACSAPRTANVPPAEGYEALAEELSRHIGRELEVKGVPALSIALVEGDEVVWAAGFGLADPEGGVQARADTVYRVGSVSKLFTDMALMQLVESGRIALDDPVTELLPGFAPENPFGVPVTFAQLARHRAGLVREPPVGHYFDDGDPTLAATVASIDDTRLVQAPGTGTKYSNAGVAALGRALELHDGRPFADLMARRLLEPMGLAGAAFQPTPGIERRLAKGFMWTYDGREFPAPTFQLGTAPAGSLYASVLDLAQFLRVVFAGGRGPGGRILEPQTLEQMMAPAVGPDGRPTHFGIGFGVRELDGRRMCGHDGAIYGFATALYFLPEERVGAAVACSMDFANAVTDEVAQHALRLLLARQEGRDPPRRAYSKPVDPVLARELVGRYRAGDARARIVYRGDRLLLEWGGLWSSVRERGGLLELDDRHVAGVPIDVVANGDLEISGTLWRREAGEEPIPAPCPERWRELIGEYGWDHNTLLIRERDGELQALVEWFLIDRLRELEQDVFALPERRGLYHGEQLTFRRDGEGRVTHALLGAVPFARRDETAPVEVGPCPVPPPRVREFRDAAPNLKRVRNWLAARGYALQYYSGRPAWKEEDPLRDCGPSIDVTLVDLTSGQAVEMTGAYGERSARSHGEYPGGTDRQRWYRDLLRAAMVAEGFWPHRFEWWRFDP